MEINNLLLKKIKNAASQNKGYITVIGIDGPTASGKTTLTNTIMKQLQEENIDSWSYRVDWALEARDKRVSDLANLKENNLAFSHEAELHMRLEIVEQFLKEVAKYNQSLTEGQSSEQTINLSELYSREHEGKLLGEDSVTLKPNLVIFFEGHYTLRTELDKYTDINMVLLGDKLEFLQRKVDRVKSYRSPDEAIDYYWRIDIPSFKNHLDNFSTNADLIIDNTDYNNPTIVNESYANKWLSEKNENELEAEPLKDSNCFEHIFSRSNLTPTELHPLFNKGLELLTNWDRTVGSYLRVNIQSIKDDLETTAHNLVSKVNSELSESQYRFEIKHFDFLSNVYYRTLPLSLSLAIINKDGEPVVSYLAEVQQKELKIKVFWRGGHKSFHLKRNLGEIILNQELHFQEKQQSSDTNHHNDKLTVMTPTDFTLPNFLKDKNINKIFIGKEDEVISSSMAVDKLLSEGGFWIHRFALYSELKFFRTILSYVGVHTVQIGNYLISMKTYDSDLRKDWKSFASQWEHSLLREDVFKQAQEEHDSIIKQDRKNAYNYVIENCKYFTIMDGHLFAHFMYDSEGVVKEALKELKSLLNSNQRVLRKRATQFIQQYFPDLNLETNKLWSEIPKDSIPKISLAEFNKLNPSILGEIYLWLAIRDEPSAILGANIYDLRSKSIDTKAHLKAASKHGCPVVLQSSLNAIGQKELEGKITSNGYLKLENGPKDFVDSITNTVRDMYLTGEELPGLYGIGLDHVSVDHDKPKGRAKRFFEQALETGKITHYVQDGAGLFKSKTRNKEDLLTSYTEMAKFSASLIEDINKCFLVDTEICLGELNYVENDSKAIIPSNEEMLWFVQTYQKQLIEENKSSLLCRPLLFIGNLGTTHHGADTEIPSVEWAKKWKDYLKKDNFISPVLHGTTNTHKDVLRKASSGCHKINVAGDFLHALVDGLPQKLSRIVKDSDLPAKKMIPAIRPHMEDFSKDEKKQIIDKVESLSKNILKTINAPKLSKMDCNYFHYNSYTYNSTQTDYITSSIETVIFNSRKDKINSPDSKPEPSHFSASMIEVPLEEFDSIVSNIWESGVRHFHIDAGDGEFITRKFSGTEKAILLRERFPDAKIHAHLMIKSPHYPHDGNICAIEQYANAGCDAIALHPRSFKKLSELKDSLKLIRNLGKRAGILIETVDTFDERLKGIITELNIDWVIVMGVPVGYGGQIFQFPTLAKIAAIKKFSKATEQEILIEVDGGLTLETISLAKKAGGEIFAGWSIIKPNEQTTLSEKITHVHNIIK